MVVVVVAMEASRAAATVVATDPAVAMVASRAVTVAAVSCNDPTFGAPDH